VNPLKDKITMTIPNAAEYVAIARLTATVIANTQGFDIEEIEDIKVAIGEACNNAVMHGKNSSNITLDFHLDEGRFLVEITDEGDGFKFEEYSEPVLEAYEGRGLGLFIIKTLMDDMIVESDMGNGTRITLIKNKE
jgi:serine/threonine-protein kinase RsbW